MSDGCYTSLNASSAVTERDELIGLREYFFAGYTYSEIITILNRRHGTTISLRQLSRRLRLLGLRRHNMPGNEGTVIEAIRREIEGSGSSLGYRAMTRRLLSSHGIVASRQTVAAVQRKLDPEGVRLRQHRQFTRRIYINKGPNYLVHIDGYDKLKPYGFPIHGAICGFSRKILWLKVARSNNDPKVVATFFLEYLNAINGVPRCIRTDAGTENVLVQDMQMAFRWEHSDDMSAERSVIIGSSHSNQRIERWWLSNRQGGCQYWIDFFKDMENAGLLSTSDELHIECVRFCFMDIIQKELDRVRMEWNQHAIRRNGPEDSPSGKPDLMYYMPELFGGVDYKVTLNQRDLDQVSSEFCYTGPIRCTSETEAQFEREMRRKHLRMPVTADEAIEVFGALNPLFRTKQRNIIVLHSHPAYTLSLIQ